MHKIFKNFLNSRRRILFLFYFEINIFIGVCILKTGITLIIHNIYYIYFFISNCSIRHYR